MPKVALHPRYLAFSKIVSQDDYEIFCQHYHLQWSYDKMQEFNKMGRKRINKIIKRVENALLNLEANGEQYRLDRIEDVKKKVDAFQNQRYSQIST